MYLRITCFLAGIMQIGAYFGYSWLGVAWAAQEPFDRHASRVYTYTRDHALCTCAPHRIMRACPSKGRSPCERSEPPELARVFIFIILGPGCPKIKI